MQSVQYREADDFLDCLLSCTTNMKHPGTVFEGSGVGGVAYSSYSCKTSIKTKWVIHQRYARPDFPKTLQIGVNAYTDWDLFKVQVEGEQLAARKYNNTLYSKGTPDLQGHVDWARFKSPLVPQSLQGKDLTATDITDAELLAFLND